MERSCILQIVEYDWGKGKREQRVSSWEEEEWRVGTFSCCCNELQPEREISKDP